MARPSVSMIVPFRGSAAELSQVVGRLSAVEPSDGDELILAWNSAEEAPVLDDPPAWLRICPASAEASSYYARNVGVRASRNDWLLFIDGDCSPTPGLLDLYFREGERPDDVGLVAGGIVGIVGATTVERYANSRKHIDQEHTLAAKPLGYGQTANLLARRSVWERIGGFAQGINSGGDADFCWRAQQIGVRLQYDAEAAVSHHHRQSVRELWRQYQKYGRGQRWLAQRFHGSVPKGPPVTMVARSCAGLALALVARDAERVSFAWLDVVSWLAACDGWFRSNAAPVLRF